MQVYHVLGVDFELLSPTLHCRRESVWNSGHPRFDGFGLYHFFKVLIRACFSIIFQVTALQPVFTASKKLHASSPELKCLIFFMHERLSTCVLRGNIWARGRQTQLPLGIKCQEPGVSQLGKIQIEI